MLFAGELPPPYAKQKVSGDYTQGRCTGFVCGLLLTEELSAAAPYQAKVSGGYTPGALCRLCMDPPLYAKFDRECFLVLTLDGAHNIISIHIATIGLVSRTIIHPREVFKHAIKDNAVSVILCHNHPSGSLLPSSEDREATELLVESGKIIGIRVLVRRVS